MRNTLLLIAFLSIICSGLGLLGQACQPCSDLTCVDDVQSALLTESNHADWRTPDYIQNYGYPVETHTVTSGDNYTLTHFRIPYGKVAPNNVPGVNKPAVFIVHGILASSMQWMFQPTDEALVFMLADAGYDVWIANSRGTNYSQGHTTLTPNDLAYWNFSFHEMGKYDVPAAINYILSKNGQSSLYYIGHSLGNVQYAIAMSLYPDLNSKIKMQFAMSPTLFIPHATNLLFQLAPVGYSAWPVLNVAANGRFLPDLLQTLAPTMGPFCDLTALNCGLCGNGWFALWGFNPCQLNYTYLPGILAHLPDSISSKTLVHVFQQKVQNDFRQFDYGSAQNLLVYNNIKPPRYDLTKLTAAVVAYEAPGDNILVPKDFAYTTTKFPNLVGNVTVPDCNFNHEDMAIGIDAHLWIYNDIIQRMNANEAALSG